MKQLQKEESVGSCYFLTGPAERVLNAVSAPDRALLNTDGATLPDFSVEEEK